MAQMRDAEVQKDRMRFRINLERCGEIMAYEVSREMSYVERNVVTPLGEIFVPVLEDQPVIGAILRAALPMHQGFLRIFDAADNAFVSAYRKHTAADHFFIQIDYVSTADLDDRTLILLDPMIATGKSLVLAYRELTRYGQPKNVFFCGVIASEEGLEYVQRNVPEARLYVGAVDNELTAKSYIVPGLGDAGDLAYGSKYKE
jgi:uracil phosphoribosyltransferase